MKSKTPVAVTSRSFSKHPVLRAEMLARYETVTFNDEGKSLKGDALAEFLKGHSKAITALEKIDESLLSKLPELEVIGKVGVGIDMLDLEAMDRHGVKLGWQGGTNKRSVSELALSLMLTSLRKIVPVNEDLRSGNWKQQKGRTLSGKTVGVVGLGNVGKDLISLLSSFGCRVLGYDVFVDSEFCESHGVEVSDLDRLLSESDIVSLHLSLNDDTRGMIGRDQLAKMKKDALIVSTARGGLVDETALKEALQSGNLGAAALDVFEQEPPVDTELLSLPNFLGTPHVGGSTEEAIVAMGRVAIEGLEKFRPARDFLKK